MLKKLLALIAVVLCLIPSSGYAATPPTPRPGEEVLFEDDFQDGKPDGWQITASWTVQQKGDVYFFNAPGAAGFAWVPAGIGWTDYILRATVRLDSEGLAIAFRGTKDARYWLFYREEGLYLLKESPRENFVPLTQTKAPALKTPHAFAIIGYGGHLQVYSDQKLQLDYVDPSPLTVGTIGLVALEGCRAAVDNVSVTKRTTALPVVSDNALPPTIGAPSVNILVQQLASLTDIGVPPVGPVPEGPAPEGPAPEGGVVPEVESQGEEAGQIVAPVWEEIPPAPGLPVIDYFTAEPIPDRPGCAYLSWDLHDATAAYLNDQGVTAPNSTEVCGVGTYTLRAENGAGSVEQSVTIVATPDNSVQTTSEPDLIISPATVQVPDATRPSRVKIDLRVVNQGDSPAGAFTVRWYPNQRDAVGCSIDVGALAAHHSGNAHCTYTYPAADVGSINWRAYVDADNEVQETSENNNEANGTIRIQAGGSPTPPPASEPDLKITRFGVQPNASADHPRRVKLTVEVTNDGTVMVGAFTLRWWPDQDLNVVGVGWSVDIPKLGPHGVFSSSGFYDYAQNGEMLWRAKVDADNDVVESNENNNLTSGTVTIADGTPTAGKPDLVITDKHFEPAQPTTGQPFKLVMTVKNNGTVASGNFSAMWRFNSPSLGLGDCTWPVIEGLLPGATHTARCERTAPASPGQALTTITVDTQHIVAESDEGNNDTTLNLAVVATGTSPTPTTPPGTAKPDLVITDKHFEPAQPVKGQPFKAVMTLKNKGNAAATKAFDTLWHFNATLGVQDCAGHIGPGLAPGAVQILTCERTTNVSPGQAPTTLTVDAQNTVAESDEVNNDTSLTMVVKAATGATPTPTTPPGGKPDLVITDKHFEPAQPVKGQPFKAVMTLKNKGNAAATKAFDTLWHFNATLGVQDCAGHIGPGLAPGAVQILTCERTTNISPGQAPTTLTVDAQNTVAESDEVNNDTSLTMVVKAATGASPTPTHPAPAGKPDLVITDKHFEPAQPVKGQPFKAVMTLKNQGNAAATKAFDTLWHFHANLGLQDCAGHIGPGLAPGAVQILTCERTTNVPPSQAPTTLTVDAQNTVAESDEVNNDTSLTLVVKAATGASPTPTHPAPAGKPDLVIRDLQLSPVTMKPGQDLTVNYKVVNAGNAAAGPSKAEWKTPPAGGLSAPCTVPALQPGQSQVCTWSFMGGPSQPNSYTTTATADVGSAVAESNEGNNKATAVLKVTAP